MSPAALVDAPAPSTGTSLPLRYRWQVPEQVYQRTSELALWLTQRRFGDIERATCRPLTHHGSLRAQAGSVRLLVPDLPVRQWVLVHAYDPLVGGGWFAQAVLRAGSPSGAPVAFELSLLPMPEGDLQVICEGLRDPRKL